MAAPTSRLEDDGIRDRTPTTSRLGLNLIHEAYTGTNPAAAAVAERRLLERYVKSKFTLGRVPIQLDHLGLGTQYIATLEINPDAPGPAIVWAHGAGAGLGWGYKNYDTLANLGGRRRRVLAFDWLGQANSSRPSFPYGGWTPLWTLSESDYIDAAKPPRCIAVFPQHC